MMTTAKVMTALLLVIVSGSARAATHTISQNGLSFDPASITIEVGDTVEWVWNSGSHTVTSGTNPSDPEVGLLFDQSLNSGNPTVTHTFIQIGSQDFFCRPHLNFGMTGTVVVTAATPVGDTPAMTGLQLLPNAPNPFNPLTNITFALPADRAGPLEVGLRIFDLKGRLVRVLLEEQVDSDRRTVSWDGRTGQGKAAPSGVYIYRLTAGGRTLARTLTLAK